ncbi:hypothetical protein BOTBODRAFT_39322 [Botryobasidium botryosum FD-172 SS1]|uniref:DUF6533 domain-containing protein n=1 Tax=Botryobasidium botryosum (strain FD-172 SS1) TaxID=930990 RepID=A0A067LUJ2_BOTB1|nr:hypothetical protein BOTBODRAFT_39322 [Botryobasidium botryosum FD-172 SS1]
MATTGLSTYAPPSPDVLWTTNAIFLASAVALVYDYFLTLGDEIERIWGRPLNGSTILFFINRYFVFIHMIINGCSLFLPVFASQTLCDRYLRYPPAGTIIILGVVEIILIIRVYALYHSDNRVLFVLLSLFTAEVILMALQTHNIARLPNPPGFAGCYFTDTNLVAMVYWIAPLVMCTVILGFTLYKTVNHRRGYPRSRMIHVIMRDGITYFCVVFGLLLLNVFLNRFAPPSAKTAGGSFSQTFAVIMTSRWALKQLCHPP